MADSDKRSLAGRTALVTGGGTGIGTGCARSLLEAGAIVTIAGRREDVLADAAKRLREEISGAEVRTTTCDVTDERQVTDAVELACNDDHLDIAVANAGTGFGSYILLTDSATFRQALDLNVLGSFNTFKAAALKMKDSGGGSLIGMSSIAGSVVHPSMPAYCSAKAGLEMLVRCSADELGPFGIRANAVAPGIVASEIMEQFVIPNREVLDDYLDNMPIKRVGTTKDIGDLVRFLASDEASWITGQIIQADGGHSLRRGPRFDGLLRPQLGPELWKSIRGSEA